MALKSIEQEWQDFAAKVIPTITQEAVQYREMKNAFFAGAFVVSVALQEIGVRPDITEEQGVNHLNGIFLEAMNHIVGQPPEVNTRDGYPGAGHYDHHQN